MREKSSGGLSVAQVIAGALASASAALLASTFGMAGTIIGAAMTSVTVTIASVLYRRSIEGARDRVRTRYQRSNGAPRSETGGPTRPRRRLAWGAIAGLHSSTTPGDILQASLESVAYRFALIHRLLCQALPQAEDIVATGAALLSSPAWMQILADVLNRPLLPSVEMEASSRGAALQALQAIGHLDDLPDVVETSGAPYRPRPAAHEIYARAIERHERLYRLMTCSALDAG